MALDVAKSMSSHRVLEFLTSSSAVGQHTHSSAHSFTLPKHVHGFVQEPENLQTNIGGTQRTVIQKAS